MVAVAELGVKSRALVHNADAQALPSYRRMAFALLPDG